MAQNVEVSLTSRAEETLRQRPFHHRTDSLDAYVSSLTICFKLEPNDMYSSKDIELYPFQR